MKEQLIGLIKFIRNLLFKLFKKYHGKLPYIIVAVVSAVIIVGTINIFEELTEELRSNYLAYYDARISGAILSYRSPTLTHYFIILTNFGHFWSYAIALVACSVLFYLKFKSWKYIGQLLLVVLLAVASSYVLKLIIMRDRPDIEHLVEVSTASYPSGHALVSMAFYGFLIYLIYTLKIGRILKIVFIALCLFLILNIGLSRIYLGVHFPSDILGGWIVGFFWIVFCVMMLNLIRIFAKDPNTRNL